MKIKHFYFLILTIACTTLLHAQLTNDVASAKIITSDITNFYAAFDLAIKDSIHAKAIFQKEYFDKASTGLKDFNKSKIPDIDYFTRIVLSYKAFYESIREDVTNIDDLKKQIYSNYATFKKLYPDAKFPDVYFVMGCFTSNGTSSKNGLLIGTELVSKTLSMNTTAWPQEIKAIVTNREHIPITVSNELIHFNQQKMRKEETLLAYAIKEGSAEFIGELISGATDGNYEAFKGREKAIWADFKDDMHKDIYNSWHKENEPRRPKNALYWVGYLICKSYYNSAPDKKKALYNILHCKNYDDLYSNSNVYHVINGY